ncbi:MAG TPA: ABC transporter ATP-binding protein [Candidatus Blautia faecigallinarum]|uniref:ABC transporter ATP-binding protein n=1 Tax=Candidatus Blautia faecigallinarum TaxID=2838488 RepID=A0A9D2DVH4_9FIRM|nr:ABC transporter ATP-binding protein [Candidatus Blautia faecigallinarum]
MAEIKLNHVTKIFNRVKVIDGLDLVIPDGKFTVLVGPSGCGKTTVLRMIAGIGPATSGHIYMDGKDITDLDPGKRDIAMVFQNYAIYPTMTVRDNIEFGLKNRKVPKEEREKRISQVTKMVGLWEMLDRKPSTLSGGQRQRIALARAMVKNPKVFLMDEPLSNLDAKLRNSMRSELIEMHKKLKATFVYVTHDQVEAMAMADRIVLLNKGKIMQQGSPRELYQDPDNTFTAQFMGTPPMNVLDYGKDIQLGFRPERAVLTKEYPDGYAYVRKARTVTCEMLGSETVYKVEANGRTVMVKSRDCDFDAEQDCWLAVPDKYLLFFDGEGKRIRPKNEKERNECIKKIRGEKNGRI